MYHDSTRQECWKLPNFECHGASITGSGKYIWDGIPQVTLWPSEKLTAASFLFFRFTDLGGVSTSNSYLGAGWCSQRDWSLTSWVSLGLDLC